jgi:hypothetical protein
MKTCFKCGSAKQISEFYSHPAMKDGHLGKCKECTKLDAINRRNINKTDPAWMKRERARGRAKSELDRILGKITESNPQLTKRWQELNPHKRRAHNKLNKAIRTGVILKPNRCSSCGKEIEQQRNLHGHHEDYSKPLAVHWLCPKCHGKRHWKDQ